jgi:IS5 family transposase
MRAYWRAVAPWHPDQQEYLDMGHSPRFQDTGSGSFYGSLAYAPVLERYQKHFLVVVDKLIDWDAINNELLALYKGEGRRGRPPYAPKVMLKMLFLSYLYNVSERSVEELVDTNLLAKWFMGLAVDERAPDHSTLRVFRRRMEKVRGGNALQALFDAVILAAKGHGVEFGELQVLDSVHTQADVSNAKEKERHENGRPPRDPDARVVHKGKRPVVKPDGTVIREEITSRGFKTHVAQNVPTGIVTTAHVTHGSAADNKAFGPIRAHDRELGLPIRAYGGDKAYDDTDIYSRLEEEGLSTAITLRALRTQKKDQNRERWLALEADPEYRARKSQRYRVEQPFGTLKRWNGFGRCRYLGLERYRTQALMTFLVHNCKRVVKLLTGVTFRPEARGQRGERITPVLGVMSLA